MGHCQPADGIPEHLAVAVATSRFPSPSQTFVLDHICQLQDRGCDVRILAAQADPNGPEHAEVIDRGLREQTVYFEPRAGLKRQRAETVARYAAKVGPRRPQLVWRSLRHGRRWKVPRSRVLGLAVAMRDLRQMDLCHAHFGPIGAALAEALEDDTPLITTFHGYDVAQVPRDFGEAIYQTLFDRGDLFLTVSQRWRTRLIELGAPPERTVVQRTGVDPRRYRRVDHRLKAEGRLSVVSVARLVEKKGIEFGLRAVRIALAEGVPVSYTIVGDGPLRASLEDLAERLGVSGSVSFMGEQSRQHVQRYLQGSDVLLAPSVTSSTGDQEGVPVVLMEAMASGLPVITTRHSGIPELVSDKDTGHLVEERDIDGMAGRLAMLWRYPELRMTLGAAARDSIERGWDAETLTTQLLERYRALLEQRRVAGRR
jgi:colanic acid/amylovoran biosynthesis glycosyltransferase